ncbi:complement C1r subcomponent [Mus pahari]|uniref:complement C1r subcomponent n=1 Tax=Mus pahari TaxID=10093 RepID=UPI000A313709|nr:complement C1r subcomponent [Mus pahari]
MWLFALLMTLFSGVEGSVYLPQKLYGEVTSPLYPKPYPSDWETTTVITVPMGYRVKLVFWHFDVEPSEGCFYDYVKISADKQTLGRFCGQLDSPLGNPPGSKEFMSQGNKMLLTFHTDFSNEENGTIMFYKGFLAYYQAVDLDECASQPNSVEEGSQPRCQHLCHNYVGGYFCSCRPGYELQKDGQSCQAECSRELYTEPSGYVSSLEYPQPYPPDLRCNYSIRVERGLTVHLKFLDPFEIDDHQQVHCPYDQLQIYAKGKNLGEFCGKQRPPDLDTSSNAVDLLFFTDESGDSRGWKLHYTTEIIKCPQPKALDEFTIIQDMQPQYQFRDYFIVTCKQGYQLMEGNQAIVSFSAVCQHDGTWHRAMPRCKIKNCGQPRSLSNGDLRYITTKGVNTYEARIQYYCNEPYYKMLTRAGSSESVRGIYTCTAQGIWKNEEEGEKMPRCLPVCGKPVNPVTQKQRIIKGQKASPGNFPWQAFTNIHGRGGGALLGDRWILTAAHTIYPKEHNKENDNDANPRTPVYLGHTNVQQIKDLGHHPVRRVIIHPDYRQDEPNNFEGDIALLELENSVTLGPELLPICLPDNETFYDKGLMGYVSGFGITEDKIANDLRFVRLPVADREACQRWLRTKKENNVFSQNMFCSGDPSIQQDACQGDSGSVFAVRDRNRDIWVATGIVSWGIGCGEGYGFYTKLLNYVDWIKKEMGEDS